MEKINNINKIKKLNVNPDDVILVKIDNWLPDKELQRLKEVREEYFKNNSMLLVGPAISDIEAMDADQKRY